MNCYVILLPVVLLTDCCLCQNVHQDAGRDDFYYDVFPEGFLWGYSSSAYQIEGAWNESGKGESAWDYYTHHNPTAIADRSNGDVACDSYHRYKEDVALLKKSGAKVYRFSIAWTRILPTGDSKNINEAGLSHYSNLIDELLDNGIEPIVTLYHWDHPQILENQGGWLNESIAFHFAEYTRIVFKYFGNRVKIWSTFNEANIYCALAYGAQASLAPGIKRSTAAAYRCGHNLIKAHGLAYRIYEKEFKAIQKGQIGINVWTLWAEPNDTNNAEDVAASHRLLQFMIGWIINPIIEGEYPEVMQRMIDEKSKMEGMKKSRLPSFNSNWKKIITGTTDYIGVNHYSTAYAYPSEKGNDLFPDSGTGTYVDPLWPQTANAIVPWGFRRTLKWVATQYCPPIMVLENGYGDFKADGIRDSGRVNFFKLYINEMLKAVKIDGVNVTGYTAWSFMDDFEWEYGYTRRFGSFYIDFAENNLQRIPKDSAKFLRKVFRENGFPKTI